MSIGDGEESSGEEARPDGADTGAADAEATESSGPGESSDPRGSPESAADTAGSRSVRFAWRKRVVPALLAVTALAGMAVVGWLWSIERNASARESAGHEALKTAKQATMTLTGLDHRRHEEQLDRLRKVATGSFQEQIDDQAELFAKTLSTHKVRSDGKVAAAGLEKLNSSEAIVVVVATATVLNARSEQEESATPEKSEDAREERRRYRMRFGMTNENGRWLVENLEFIP